MSTLAIEGGTPVRTRPFPSRAPFGPADAQQVLEALDQQTLFFPGGRKVYEFQKQFGALYGVNHVVCSTSGTSAIHVAVGAIDPEPGDEIITTPISDMGTVAPIILQAAIPIFADVDPMTGILDPDDVERKITERTKAIIVVHCWGQAADMDRFMAIARRHHLYLIEDCAQSHLTRYKGRPTGTIGDLGAFSLQDSKHLQFYLFEALTEQVTFGRSQFPFRSPYARRPVQYGPGLCPRAEQMMTQLRTISINERCTEEDIDDIARAVRKVAEEYARRR